MNAEAYYVDDTRFPIPNQFERYPQMKKSSGWSWGGAWNTFLHFATIALAAAILGIVVNERNNFSHLFPVSPGDLPVPGNGPILICHHPGPNQIQMRIQNKHSVIDAHLSHLGGKDL